jgi:hypothetical protein
MFANRFIIIICYSQFVASVTSYVRSVRVVVQSVKFANIIVKAKHALRPAMRTTISATKEWIMRQKKAYVFHVTRNVMDAPAQRLLTVSAA